MIRFPLSLIAPFLLVTAGFAFLNEVAGVSSDLAIRRNTLYLAAWILAGLIVCGLTFRARQKWTDRTVAIWRSILTGFLFWPIFGAATPIAEEWTIAHRKATWTSVGDMGWTYMYPELSGMGYAQGIQGIWTGIYSMTTFGILSAIVWIPSIFIGFLIADRVIVWIRPSRAPKSDSHSVV